jgi:nicotinamide mononucleotide (NMN) deamidase PncC
LGVSESSERELVERIHASGKRCVVALTGGGSRAIADLLAVPGASATMLEAVVPYAPQALALWLRGKVDHACSEPTARAMAMAAFERCRKLSDADPTSLRGIGATASLATTRPKRGPHRVHVAWQSAQATVSYSCELAKGRRTRAEEEAVAARLVLHAVAESCDANNCDVAPDPSADERVVRREKLAPAAWTGLLLGNRNSVMEPDGSVSRVLFPGAFHPPHAGHRRMAEIAAARCGAPVTLELSIANVDKPTLDFLEIADRLAGLSENRVLLTRAATFVDKAALVPGAVFVVGADTLARIADPAYYGGSSEQRDAAIAAIAGRGCRFLVFGRLLGERFCLPSDLELPPQLRDLCDAVPENEFRQDIRSTELRADA